MSKLPYAEMWQNLLHVVMSLLEDTEVVLFFSAYERAKVGVSFPGLVPSQFNLS